MIHTQVGAGIVKPVVNEKVVAIVEHHHDHYDGTGLHQMVAGEKIPLGARILAVADAYDAMTSDRPYRPSIPVEEAREEIKRCSGTQFDPAVVKAFLEVNPM
jgi:HD-GYP domain-containing protein (c-di-GMP phosphodiesterase class II)